MHPRTCMGRVARAKQVLRAAEDGVLATWLCPARAMTQLHPWRAPVCHPAQATGRLVASRLTLGAFRSLGPSPGAVQLVFLCPQFCLRLQTTSSSSWTGTSWSCRWKGCRCSARGWSPPCPGSSRSRCCGIASAERRRVRATVAPPWPDSLFPEWSGQATVNGEH